MTDCDRAIPTVLVGSSYRAQGKTAEASLSISLCWPKRDPFVCTFGSSQSSAKELKFKARLTAVSRGSAWGSAK